MCYINYDSQLTAYKTSSIYSNSASNLPCLLCSRLCFWSNLQKPDILGFLSHSDHEQLSSFRRPISNRYLRAVLFTPHWMSAWLVHVLFAVQGAFRERSGASPGLQRCGWRSEVCQLPVETARHASVLLLAPSLRYSPVSSVSFAKGVSFAKFKTPAVMTGHRGKYQNSPNQKCSFRPTTVKIYTSDFLHWQDWKSSNSILSTLHVGCSVDSVRKLNLKSEFNWSWRDLFLQTVIMSQSVGSDVLLFDPQCEQKSILQAYKYVKTFV